TNQPTQRSHRHVEIMPPVSGLVRCMSYQPRNRCCLRTSQTTKLAVNTLPTEVPIPRDGYDVGNHPGSRGWEPIQTPLEAAHGKSSLQMSISRTQNEYEIKY